MLCAVSFQGIPPYADFEVEISKKHNSRIDDAKFLHEQQRNHIMRGSFPPESLVVVSACENKYFLSSGVVIIAIESFCMTK